VGADAAVRVDLFHEDGYGGRRTGAHGALSLVVSSPVTLRGRLSIVDFAGDLRRPGATSASVQAAATYRLSSSAALSVLAEETSNQLDRHQFRLLGVIDLNVGAGATAVQRGQSGGV
jgi:hypothetical protein